MKELEKIKKEKIKELLKKSDKAKMETEIEVNDNNFEEKVIQQSKKIPVVVDFWAEWCPPCHMLSPTLEKFVKEYKGKFILAKLNVGEGRLTSQTYSITSIPAVKLFKDSKVVAEFVGALPEDAVKEWLDENLK